MSEPSSPDPGASREVAEATRYAVRRVGELFTASGLAHPDHYLLMVAIMRAHRRMTSRVAALLEGHKLNFSHYTLLVTLEIRGRDRPLLLSRLARRMMVHPTTVTLRMDELEKRGLVRREQHPSDRRAVLASLTPEGGALIDDVMREMSAVRFGLDGLSAQTAREISARLIPVLDAGFDGPQRS